MKSQKATTKTTSDAGLRLFVVAHDGGRTERELSAALVRELSGTTLETLATARDASKADFVVVDRKTCPEAMWKELLSQHASRLIVITTCDDKDNINTLLKPTRLSHMVGRNGRDYVREIIISLRKHQTGDVFGLDKYSGPGALHVGGTISNAEEINPTIERLLTRMQLETSFSATVDLLRLTANELCTNAVYNAPVDKDNVPKYEQTDRKVKVQLEPTETVHLEMFCDDDYVGIAVSDQFGRLDRDKIVRHLVKCVNNTRFIENKKGGAGAGIYLAFYSANQFVINVEQGKKLEAICILEKSKRYKDYKLRVTSFNYFVAGAKRKMGGAA